MKAIQKIVSLKAIILLWLTAQYTKTKNYILARKDASATIAFILGGFVFYAVFFFVYTHVNADFSGMFYRISNAITAIILLRLTDDVLLNRIDTMELLSKDAKAYAIYLLAFAIVIAWVFANI